MPTKSRFSANNRIRDRVIAPQLTVIGTCKIQSIFLNSDGTEAYRAKPEVYHNIVNRRSYELLFDNERVFDDTREIGVSTDNETINYNTTQINNVIAIADGSFSSPNDYVFTPFSEGVNPNFVTYAKRLSAPTVARSYQTILIGDGSPNNDTGGITMNCYAYLTLPSPKDQATNQIDDITYQVNVLWQNPPINLSPHYQEELELLLLGQFPNNAFPAGGIGYGRVENSTQNANLNNTSGLPFDMTRPNLLGTAETVTDSKTLLKKRVINASTGSFPQNYIQYGVKCGRAETVDTQGDRFKGGGIFKPYRVASKLSRVYGHNTSEAMFNDDNDLPTSSWKPIPADNGIPTRGHLPHVYQIVVKTSGGLGTGGTYFFRKGVYSGGLTTNDIRNLPYGHQATQFFPAYDKDGTEAIPFRVEWVYPWKRDTDFVSANKTKLGIWQGYPELEILEEVDLAANVTRIRDIAVDKDNDLVYVAGDTGLVSVNVSTPGSPVVTQLSSDACRCVGVSFGGAVFAILLGGTGGDRLASSLQPDWDTAYTFSGTIDYSKCVFLRPAANAAHEMAILEHRYDLYLDTFTLDAPGNGNYFQKIHFFSVSGGFDSTVDCICRHSTAVNWSKATSLTTNNSIAYKDGVWAYYKHQQTATPNQNGSLMRGYPSEALEVIRAGGTEPSPAPDYSFVNTAFALPTNYHIGMAQFGNEISGETYNNSSGVMNDLPQSGQYCTPAIQIMSVDVPGNVVRACLAGYNSVNSASFAYTTTRLRETYGCFDFEVDDTNSNDNRRSTFRAYPDVNHFHFTHYSNGSGSVPLYYLGQNIIYLEGKGFLCFGDSGVSSANFELGGFNRDTDGSQPYYHPLVFGFWGVPNKTAFDHPEWVTQYGWDSINSVWVEDPLGQEDGKPLHTAQEPLDPEFNITLGWEDQAPLQAPPQSSQDLVINQTYTWVVIPYENSFVADGTYTGDQDVSYVMFLRPIEIVEGYSDTIPAIAPFELDIPEAVGDPLFLAIDDEDAFLYSLQINGTDADIVFNVAPSQGEIAVNTATRGVGRYTFNSADASLPVTGDYAYLQKVHSTETI